MCQKKLTHNHQSTDGLDIVGSTIDSKRQTIEEFLILLQERRRAISASAMLVRFVPESEIQK